MGLWRRTSAIALVGSIAAITASGGDRERLELLQADVDEVQRQLYDMRRDMDRLATDMRRVVELVEGSGDRSALARFNANVESLRSDINGLGGRFDETTDRLRRIEEHLARAPSGASGTTADGSAAMAGGPVAPAIDDATATSLYNQAYADYIKDDFDLALDEFRDFAVRYPGHEMAPNALYWGGMIHVGRENWAQALVEFDALLARHARATVVPDAMYRKGEVLVQLDRLGQAVLILNEVRTRHAGTAAARNAEERLKEIAQSGR